MTRLHVFDMDGTLLRGTTASLEIAGQLGCRDTLVELEEKFAAGTVGAYDFAAELHTIWSDLTPTIVETAFTTAPWIGGLKEVLADIRAKGEYSIVVTMSPDFFAQHLSTFGVDRIIASRYPPLPFRSRPSRADIMTPIQKVHAVDCVLSDLSLDHDRCIAYGDSTSDIPLFRYLRHTVAINATTNLRALAKLHYDGEDLRVPYQAVRSWSGTTFD